MLKYNDKPLTEMTKDELIEIIEGLYKAYGCDKQEQKKTGNWQVLLVSSIWNNI